MLGSLGPKEAKKAFLDFYHSFLEKTAVRDTSEGPQYPSALGQESHPAPPSPRLVQGGLALRPLPPPLRPPGAPRLLPQHCRVLPFTPSSLLSRFCGCQSLPQSPLNLVRRAGGTAG